MTTLLPFKNNTSCLTVLSVMNSAHHSYPPQNSTEEHCLKEPYKKCTHKVVHFHGRKYMRHKFLDSTWIPHPNSIKNKLQNQMSHSKTKITRKSSNTSEGKACHKILRWPLCLSENTTGDYETYKSELNFRKTQLSPKSFSKAMSVCQIRKSTIFSQEERSGA